MKETLLGYKAAIKLITELADCSRIDTPPWITEEIAARILSLAQESSFSTQKRDTRTTDQEHYLESWAQLSEAVYAAVPDLKTFVANELQKLGFAPEKKRQRRRLLAHGLNLDSEMREKREMPLPHSHTKVHFREMLLGVALPNRDGVCCIAYTRVLIARALTAIL